MSSNRKAFQTLTSKFILLAEDNIDTDQIIPARFLTTTSREGLGKGMFYDWRYDESGQPKKDSPFDNPHRKRSRILVAGQNFGCGSSREHAPWAIDDFGFRAIMATSFADIFKSNALKIGLLPVEISEKALVWFKNHPDEDTTIDLEAGEVRCGDELICAFEIEAFARYQLMNGMDDMDYLLAQNDNIKAFEEARS